MSTLNRVLAGVVTAATARAMVGAINQAHRQS
jgi:hypothetical protein